MADTTIVGVDFSGGQQDTNTWIAKAKLTPETRTLEIKTCERIKRACLTVCLKDLPDGSVAALDFPFSVPIAFAKYLGQPSAEMPELWDRVGKMCLNEFIEKRNAFVSDDRTREYLRIGDLEFSGAVSCLHDTNPNMVPMTFYGMKMLHQLRQCGEFEIPPLMGSREGSPVLLETMPGAALTKYALLPKYKGYKSKKNKVEASERRAKIFEELRTVMEPCLTITWEDFNRIRDDCKASDDCPDALVACTVAALWAMDESGTKFCQPTDVKVTALRRKNARRQASPQVLYEGLTKRQAAEREGWIYAPTLLRSK